MDFDADPNNEIESPQEVFDGIISAIAFPPSKALTLLFLDETPQTGEEIRKAYIQITGDKIYKSAFADYCRNTLIPIGLVAEETFVRSGGYEESIGFVLTEKGKTTGRALAHFMVNKIISYYEHNLPQFFFKLGRSNSVTDEHAPSRRAKVLTILRQMQTDEISIGELNEKLLENYDIELSKGTLEELDVAGIVQFESIGSTQGWAQYELNVSTDELLQSNFASGTPTERLVIDAFVNNPDTPISSYDVSRQPTPAKVATVGMILRNMYENGLIRPTQFHGTASISEDFLRSKVSLTPEGEIFADDLIEMRNLVDKLSNLEVLPNFTKLSRQDAQLVVELWEPYRIRGGIDGLKRMANDEQTIKKLISNLVLENGQLPTQADIFRLTGYKRPAMQRLIESGEVHQLRLPANKSKVYLYLSDHQAVASEMEAASQTLSPQEVLKQTHSDIQDIITQILTKKGPARQQEILHRLRDLGYGRRTRLLERFIDEGIIKANKYTEKSVLLYIAGQEEQVEAIIQEASDKRRKPQDRAAYERSLQDRRDSVLATIAQNDSYISKQTLIDSYSQKIVENMVRRGELASIKIGNRVFICHPDDIELVRQKLTQET